MYSQDMTILYNFSCTDTHTFHFLAYVPVYSETSLAFPGFEGRSTCVRPHQPRWACDQDHLGIAQLLEAVMFETSSTKRFTLK